MRFIELKSLIAKKIEYYKEDINKERLGFYIRLLEKYDKQPEGLLFEMEYGDYILAKLIEKNIEEKDDYDCCSYVNFIDSASILSLFEACKNNELRNKDTLCFKVLHNGELMDIPDEDKEKLITFFEKIHKIGMMTHLYTINVIKKTYEFNMDVLQREIKKVRKLKKYYIVDEKAISTGERKLKENVIRSSEGQEIISFIRDLFETARIETSGLNSNNIKSIVKSYQKLLRLLEEKNNDSEITEIDKIKNCIFDDDIKEACLQYINEHNLKYYKELAKELGEKENSTINQYISYFKSIKIDFSQLKEQLQKKIMEESVEEIKEKMELITPIVDKDLYIEVLINNSKEKLDEINRNVAKGYLTQSFIKEHINMLKDGELYDKVKENIGILSSHRISLKKHVDKSILLTDSTVLRDNTNLLKRLNLSVSSANNLDMLKAPLKEKIERLIEVGLEEQLIQNPDILNSDDNLPKRIILANMVGEQIIENGKIRNLVLDKDLFFLPDGKIEKYMFDRDNSKYVNNAKIFLSSDNSTKLSYRVGDIIIPITRVLSQPVELSSIIKPSLYTKEEVKKLEKLL